MGAIPDAAHKISAKKSTPIRPSHVHESREQVETVRSSYPTAARPDIHAKGTGVGIRQPAGVGEVGKGFGGNRGDNPSRKTNGEG